MRIIAADDEPLALRMLCEAIRQVVPDAAVAVFSKPSALLAFARENPVDVAFLAVRMRDMSGVELARQLKAFAPGVNIIFVTDHREYALEAMALHASGYILKPVSAEKVRAELSDLRRPVEPVATAVLRVKCFGNFDVYTPDGARLHFERAKAKELLAYLVYRSGTSSSVREIAAALFEDGIYDKKRQGYVQKIISSMMKTLRSVGAQAAIVKSYNSLSVDVALVDCDYYRFAALDRLAVNAYAGEFMAQYAWAELAIGYLEAIYRNQ